MQRRPDGPQWRRRGWIGRNDNRFFHGRAAQVVAQFGMFGQDNGQRAATVGYDFHEPFEPYERLGMYVARFIDDKHHGLRRRMSSRKARSRSLQWVGILGERGAVCVDGKRLGHARPCDAHRGLCLGAALASRVRRRLSVNARNEKSVTLNTTFCP
jgi:hypothetical protein